MNTVTPPTTPLKRGLSATPPPNVRENYVKRPRYVVAAPAIYAVIDDAGYMGDLDGME